MNSGKLVVGVVGMPGAGKSLVVEEAQRRGYTVIVMGDVVREETRKRELELNPKNVGQVMMELRKTGGNGVIAEKCVPKIEHADSAHVIIDGLRSLREVDVFKAHFPKFTLIAVYASPQTRFKRLNYRRRSDDSNEWAVFRERDLRELSVGLGSAIALAEYLVVNEKLKKETSKQVQEILRRVERKWMK